MVNKTLESIYGSVSGLNEWNNGLKKISSYCMDHSGGGASLIPLDEGMQEWRFGSNDDKKADFLYYSYWKNKSPLLSCIKKNINQKLFFLDDSFLSNNEISKNPFYQEFLREFGVKRIHNAIFRLDSGERFLFSIQEALDEKEENQNEIANKFKTLTPHVIQALSLSIKFYNLQNECAVSKKVFNHLGCFFVFLDEKNQFIYTNVSVYDLEQKGIRIKENKVYIENLKYRNSFKSLLNSDEEFRFFSFYHNDEKINSRIINLPKQYNFLGEDHKNSKKVVIFSPAMVSYNTENILKELFLSPKQAQLACLIANGLTIKDASSKMNISEGTARQMVKDIFSRLEINSQNKLVSFVKNIGFISY